MDVGMGRGVRRQSQSGAALIFAILVSLLLGVFAGFFTYKAQQHIELAKQVSDQLSARMIAGSAVKQAIYAMSSLQYSGVEWPGTGQKFTTKPWGEPLKINDNLSVGYQELGAKLSLVPFHRREWVNVMQYYGLSDISAQAIADKMEDWIDSDSFRRIQGLERRGYAYQNSGVYPRNMVMQTLDEISYIPGMNRQLLKLLKAEAVHWGSTSRSPMQGSEAMIRSYGDQALYEQVLKQRNENGSLRPIYNSLQDVDVSVVNDVPSGTFRILLDVNHGQARFRREVDVNLRGTDTMPFYIIGWQ